AVTTLVSGGTLDYPTALALEGSTLFAMGSETVQSIDLTSQQVTTVAGTQGVGSLTCTDGVGAAVTFDVPYGLASDGAGNLYFVDNQCMNLRRLSIATTTVTTLAGSVGPLAPTMSVDGT